MPLGVPDEPVLVVELPHAPNPSAAINVKANPTDFFIWLLSLPESPKFQLKFYSLGRLVTSISVPAGVKSTPSSRPFHMTVGSPGSAAATPRPPPSAILPGARRLIPSL